MRLRGLRVLETPSAGAIVDVPLELFATALELRLAIDGLLCVIATIVVVVRACAVRRALGSRWLSALRIRCFSHRSRTPKTILSLIKMLNLQVIESSSVVRTALMSVTIEQRGLHLLVNQILIKE